MTKRVEHTDVYHGEVVADPYRWLEDDVRTNPEVADWVREQNVLTAAFFDEIPEREQIFKRITELFNYERIGAPFEVGGKIYFYRNDGLQNQSVLYMQTDEQAEPQVLIDPNLWSEDGTIALGGLEFSPDGRYVVYSVQESGSDWHVWRVMEIESRAILAEEMRWLKFNSPTWTVDGKGFFYARFPKPEEGAEFQNLNTNQAIYYHRVGTDQSEDVLVFHRADHPEWGYRCQVSEDGRYLIITVHVTTENKYRVFCKDLTEPFEQPRILISTFENQFSFIGNDATNFYFFTDLDAPRKRIVSLDIRQVPHVIEAEAEKNLKPANLPFRELVPQQNESLTDATLVGNVFFIESLKDAKTQVALYRQDGSFVRIIEFPGIGSASGFKGNRSSAKTYYLYSSFNQPPSTYRYDILTGESQLIRQAKVNFDPAEYMVSQVFYPSKDGTKISMFLAHKKGLELDGSHPTLLYGYGGFNISLTPGFSVSRLQWMEMGGVFALANLRGGGEYGADWHLAGTKLSKQNVFDDFIAAAEWLIANQYTQPKKLAIQGGSNGGLLVGACEIQRPDLFGACLPAVGVMDMLRFQKFTAGRYWVSDYGSSDHPEEYAALRKYSPYHNIEEGKCYPPTLVLTADTDDRVVPGHSFKFAAAMQHAQSCDNPILIRIETKAGHGAGKPISKLIEEAADQWAFLYHCLEMKATFPIQ